MNNMTKLNLLHDLANLTDSRAMGKMTSKCLEVELKLAGWASKFEESYLSMPLPEKLTLSELKWVLRVLKA